MKKLGKKIYLQEVTLEAYSGCNCGCGAACSDASFYMTSYNMSYGRNSN